ncbi:hypothetical protein EZS27_023078 [termite gut metagenome]|uniref:ABC3 transporter permease C-terminal domain-containing protein n=1 Tax=termite gut metagenome TaxID=433724 RepID=A0A5J4R2N2_9ZZZZ
MNLVKANITFYIRFYRLIALAVLIMTAVIVGSFVVGESVRSTLVQRVYERLGDTETILFSKNSFLESSVITNPLFEGHARSILVSNGFISDAGRMIPVMVWGVDDKEIPSRGVKINQALAEELTYRDADVEGRDIVLRLPATGLVPSGSLFVTDNYTTSARFALEGIVPAEDGGNLNVKNEQILPYNIFINRAELASILDIEGRINLILCNKIVSYADFAGIWHPSLSGIKENSHGEFAEITSDRMFIQRDAVQTLYTHNSESNRLFSYLVNSITVGNRSIPYSFATAADQYRGRALQENEIILSDYAAKRIGAKVNDAIRLTYFVSKDLKTLSTDTLYSRVGQIVPLGELFADKTLSADFPGLSDMEKCTDWDSDLPINMDLITKEDEDYWAQYRTTPKALVSYRAIYEKWGNAYGSATAIRNDKPFNTSGLDASMFGVQIIYPKELGLSAARNGVDFSSLFLSLGFFIILSAILLMLVPLSEMMYVRRNEIALFSALGYPKKRITGILWRESAPVVFVSSLIGIVAGLLYTWLILVLLGSLWKGATHTGGFVLFPNMGSVLTGFMAGIAVSLILLRVAIVRALKNHASNRKIQNNSLRRKLCLALVFTLATIISVYWAAANAISLFVVAGVLLIVTAACWGDYVVSRWGVPQSGLFHSSKLIWANLYANKKRVLLSFFTLTAGVFIVFSVGLNRRGFTDNAQLISGTGGYSLWCESSVPMYHNIATQAGREKLALNDLPEDTRVIQITRYSADDASCLNLNKVSQPTVLGLDMELLKTADFEIERSMYLAGEAVFEAVQTAVDSIYPVLIDETVLMWGLMLNLGDTISYESGTGKKVYLQLAGTLKNSIFQGNVLMDKRLFSEIWNEITGSEIALFQVDEQETEKTKRLLEQALNEYGVKVTTTAQRLKEFNSVTDAYLNIFLTLGGLGLLLGIMSFIIVVRKDFVSRREQISLLHSLGFTNTRIEKLLVKENRIVPLYAIVTGVLGSLTGVVSGLLNVSIWIWLTTILLTALLTLCVIAFVRFKI